MTASRKVITAIAITIVVTMLAVGLSGSEMAMSDGRKPTAPFVFPYAMLAVHLFNVSSLSFAILALGQFPLYGAILAWAWVVNCVGKVWWRMGLVHTLVGTASAFLWSIDPL